MKENILKDEWGMAKEKVRYRWTKLSSEDISAVAGDREKLIASVQKKYDIDRTEAEMQVADFESNLKLADFPSGRMA
jgi:uncharacterized protein YjbJ (UPF0337 family)